MSARSKDMIGAVLIAAGIPMAAEIHLAAGPSTLAFASYWKDWFENDRYHDSTNCIQVGYNALVEGRGDVLLAAPRTDLVISSNLSWSKDNTHLVGAGQIWSVRPNVLLRPGGAAVTEMVQIDATGCIFSGLTMRNAAVTASSACITTLRLTTNSVGFVGRNLFLWGPEDDTINDTTGGWKLMHVAGGDSLFERCHFGYGWPINDNSVSPVACLVKFQKNLFTHAQFIDCDFNAEFKDNKSLFIMMEQSPAAGAYWTYRNCHFTNMGSTALTYAIGGIGGGVISTEKNLLYFDGNCAFHGVTDIAHAGNEAYIKFSPSQVTSSTATDGFKFCGLAQSFDHTTG